MATKAVGQITVFDYSDGYSVMLTNPSYTFIGDENSVRGAQSVTTRVVAMQGASQINASVDTSQIIKPTGFTVTSNGATPSPTLTIQANQSVTDAGVLTIPVTVATGVTVSLQWSYSIAFTGGKGGTGDAGRGVTGTTVQYAPGTLPTTPPSSGWDDTVPSVDEGKYLWVKTVFTYSSGDPVTTYSVAKQGEKGSTGNGVSSTVVEYAESTSGVTPPATIASWGPDIPNVAQGNYLWTRTTTNYTGSNPTVSYSVARIGKDGEPATTYSLIVSHAAIVKSASGTFSPTSITLTAKSQTGTNAYANYSGRFKIEVYNGSSWSTKYTSSSNENTKSYTIPSGTTQVRCSLYLAGGTTTLLDQQTIPVVSDGAAGGDAYTIILDNESHTFAGGTSAAIAGTATVNVYAYKGTTAIAPTVTKANISGLPTGMTAQSVTNDSSNNKTTIVFAVTTSMTTRSGLVTIPVVADGKTFNKEFSYSLALQGAKGDTGDKGDKGDKGDTGKSLTGITEYYARNNSTTAPADSAFNTSVLTPTASEKYVWNYEQLSWNDNGTTSTTKTTKHIIAVYGDKGETGDKGNTGKSLTNVTEYYAVNNSTTAPADSSFSTTVATPTSSNKYLWNYELLTWDDNGTTSTTKTDKHIAAVYGDKGDKGDTGKALTGITEYYALNNSTTAPADSSFSTTVKTPTASNKYVWNYEQLSWNDNGTTSTTKTTKHIVAVYGDKGDQGDKGNTGKALTGITEYYAINNSTTAPADSAFDTSVKSPTSSNKYLWNYELLAWNDNGTTSTTKTDKHIAAVYGDKGDKGDKGDDGVGVTSITKTGTSGTVDTYTITYTDGTTSTFSVTNGTNGTSAEWFYGTALTHTSGTATATISGAKVGDMYLNTATSNVYKCTAANTWTYAGNIADGVLDNIEVGGRNLFKKQPISYIPANYPAYSLSLTELLEPYTPYTIQLWDVDVAHSGKTAEQLGIGVYWGGPNLRVAGWQGTNWFTDGHADYLSQTFTVTAAQIERWSTDTSNFWFRLYNSPPSANGTRFMSIGKWKLEKGNVATDWTPAPEDVDASIATAQSTADRKKQTFITTPTPPYYEGDAYFKTESGESGSAQWYVCTNTRLTAYGTGESWEDDFEPTSYALEATLQNTKAELLEEDKKIKASVEEQKKYTDGKVTPLETRTSTLEQTTDNLTIDFNREISGLKERTESNENDLSSYQKVFAFTENGLQISEQRDKVQTPSVLQIDNGRISFIVDGQESSYWSGENSMFYVGDIVVGLNKKAQFGNFAWIPRSNGNLSFRWVGSAEDNN